MRAFYIAATRACRRASLPGTTVTSAMVQQALSENEPKLALAKVLCRLRKRDFKKSPPPVVPEIISVAEASAAALACPLIMLEPMLSSMLEQVDNEAAASSCGPGGGGGGGLGESSDESEGDLELGDGHVDPFAAVYRAHRMFEKSGLDL